jgi:hypothetical protein
MINQVNIITYAVLYRMMNTVIKNGRKIKICSVFQQLKIMLKSMRRLTKNGVISSVEIPINLKLLCRERLNL